MIVLDDNNSDVEPTHLMVTLTVVTTWYSQIDACRWCSWSLGELMMVPWWFDWLWWWRWNLFDVVEPRWWRWSLFDDDVAWRCFDDALCLHSLHWCMWLDPMLYDALGPWWWWHDVDDDMTYIDVMLWWAYEPWWVSAMPWLLMRFPYPFLNPSSPLHTLKPFLAPYTTP